MANELLTWKTPEFEKHKKSTGWYVWAAIFLFILLIYCIKTSNFLFAVILLMVSVIVVLFDFREANEVEFSITKTGVKFGEKIYPYEELGRFWIVYEPPEVKKLYVESKSVIQPRLAIPLDDIDPNKVRGILSEYLAEDLEEKDEPFADYLGRALKL